MRRVVLVVLATLVLLSAGGWVAIAASSGTVGHVADAARAASALADRSSAVRGVSRASVRYQPLDANGESVDVAVQVRPSASMTDLQHVTDLVRSRLTAGPLKGVHQTVRISQDGISGGELRFTDAGDWPAARALAGWFTRWHQLEKAGGVTLRIAHSAKSGTQVGFVVGSPADSGRFIAHLHDVNRLLGGIFVLGRGFSASGPAPTGTVAVYRAMIRSHEPSDPASTRMPDRPVGIVSWGADSLAVALAAPRAQSRPSPDDARVAVALLGSRVERTRFRSLTWTNGEDSAGVVLSGCPNAQRTITVGDRALASEMRAIGHPLRRPAVVGTCGG